MRCIAAFAVVLIHVAAWFVLHLKDSLSNLYELSSALATWSVPIFVMISGALFLERELTISEMYKKYILRILISLVFWSVVYAIANNEGGMLSLGFWGMVLDGFGHGWFMYMIAGLYMITPILKKITESEKITIYFLSLAVCFAVLLPRIVSIYSFVTGREASIITSKINQINMYLPLGYSCYFVLGWFLNKHQISTKMETLIYVLGIISFILTLCAYLINSGDNIIRSVFKREYLTPGVFFESAAIFVLCKKHFRMRTKQNGIVSHTAKCSFGIYLVHILIMNFLFDYVDIIRYVGSSPISVWVVAALTYLLSLLASFLINRIPFLNRYII